MILDKLPHNIQDTLLICSNLAKELSINIYLIGGVVRDLLLETQTTDIDMCVEFDAVLFAQTLENKKHAKILQIQPDLKTAKVQFNNNVILDIASTREEYYPNASHLPQISHFGCPLIQDVKRRDFTVNSIAISLNNNNYGEIIDYLNGLENLKNKQLKILHEKSFTDDPSRIVRGLKYATKLGLTFEEKTNLIKNNFLSNKPENICYSRIMNEIQQVFELYPKNALENFYNFNLEKLFDTKKNENYKNLETILEKFNIQPDWFSYFGFIICSISTDMQEKLNLENSQKKVLNDYQKLTENSYISNSNFDIYQKFVNKNILSLAIYYTNTQNQDVITYIEKLQYSSPKITGDDLIKLGLKPSKQFKNILNSILQEKLNGNLQTKKDEIEFVQKNFL